MTISLGETGVISPMSNITRMLVEAGHEVHFVSNGSEEYRNKNKSLMTDTGATVVFTGDNIVRSDLMRNPLPGEKKLVE